MKSYRSLAPLKRKNVSKKYIKLGFYLRIPTQSVSKNIISGLSDSTPVN